jgi:hypothetical protein
LPCRARLPLAKEERQRKKGKAIMGGEGQILKRIPRIKFPQRHPKSSASGSLSLYIFFSFFPLLLVNFVVMTSICTYMMIDSYTSYLNGSLRKKYWDGKFGSNFN